MRIAGTAALWLPLVSHACLAEALPVNPGFESRDYTGWITNGSGWTIDKQLHSEGR